MLLKNRLIMKRGDTEAGEIRYKNIKKDLQGLDNIEVQGKFITGWIGKRIVLNQIITTDSTQNILRRIVSENVTSPAVTARKIPNVFIDDIPGLGSNVIEYASEPHINALLACETAAKAAELGFHIYADVKQKQYHFRIYKGMDLTADQTTNAPCVFSQEFDNILEQEYTNSVENLRSTAYVGGEEKQDVPRKVVEVGGAAAGLNRDEVFIKATDIRQTYRNDNGQQTTMSDAQYTNMLSQRGVTELEKYVETLSFAGKINVRLMRLSIRRSQ